MKWAWAAVLLLGCSATRETATQVMVVIEASSGVQDTTSNVEVTVRAGQGEASGWEDRYDKTLAAHSADAWPFELSLLPKSDDATRVYEVTATALDDGGDPIARVRAISGFVPHNALRLVLRFDDGCVGKADLCKSGKSCKSGACVDAHVNANSLSAFVPKESSPPSKTDSDAGAAGSSGHGNGGSGSGALDDAGSPGTAGSGGTGTGGDDGTSATDSGTGDAGPCKGSTRDADDDGVLDCIDGCPKDANKTAPGSCGCGQADTDSDTDKTLDCNDDCPTDKHKVSAGACGCGVKDDDSDDDGVADCMDACRSDANKSEPGACGCGVADTDADNDGTPDCDDGCPADADKQSADTCGCGVADIDTDHDGTLDCLDACPTSATNFVGCFAYVPSNVDPSLLTFANSPSWNCNASGTTTVDSTAGTVTSTSCALGTLDIANGVAQLDSSGPTVMVVRLKGLTVSNSHVLKLIGDKPIVFLVAGDVLIDTGAQLDASAGGITPGAGGNWSCGTSQGGNGSGDTGRFNGASGGGGGGFGTAGGKAGTANTDGNDVNGGIAGVTRADTNVAPLMGGCAGGQAGDCSTVGGAGGGAVQVSASGTLTVTGTVRANGGAGATPCGSNDAGGGTGGGSGGAIFLEGASVTATGSTLQANGGNGGKNGDYDGIFDCGGSNGGAGSTSPLSAGVAGPNCQGGSSGGGGGFGRVRTRVGTP